MPSKRHTEELKGKKSGCEKEVKALEKKEARIKKAIITLDEEDVGDRDLCSKRMGDWEIWVAG